MIARIDNICKVEYSTLEEIISFALPSPTEDSAVVDTTWHELDVAPGSLLSINQTGDRFECSFSGTIRTPLVSPTDGGLGVAKKPMIIRLTLTDGEPILIGDETIPVRLPESHTLQGKTITFTHTSWHYPYAVTEPE